MDNIRWYDKNIILKEVFKFIEKLDEESQKEIGKDIIQLLMKDLHLNTDTEINDIIKNYNYECKRWYDTNVDLFTAFEIIKMLNDKQQSEIAKCIMESALLMYFKDE